MDDIVALPEFADPPVLEVVVGIQFDRLQLLQTGHFGQFWEGIKEAFPTSQDAPPLPDLNMTASLTIEVLSLPPLRRMMLISSDNRYVIQVQDTRFHLNWRETKDTVYPRFNAIFERFKEYWGAFESFVRLAGLGSLKVKGYELTYVNHIDAAAPNFAASVAKRVKVFRWEDAITEFLPEPVSLAASWHFKLPGDKGQLTAALSHARREKEKEDVVVLNMGCVGLASEAYTLDSWFGTAHEWIVRGFTDLTTEEAHQHWGRRS